MSNNIIGGILCGGLGKRLRPITDYTPKSLIEIKENYSILDRQLFQMKYAGIGQVCLLSGYLHEKIEEKYGKSWNGMKITYSIEEKPGGTLYAINSLLKEYDFQRYLVMNGDIVTDMNIRQMLDHFTINTASIAVTKLVSPYGIVELSNGKISGFKEKPTLPYYINAGIYIIDCSIKDRFLAFDEGAVEKAVFPSLAKEGLLNYYMEEGAFWQSVDSQKDLEIVKKEFVNRIDKPWGYEKSIAISDKYMTTQYYVMKECSIPMHYHMERDETIHIISGEGYLDLDDEKVKVSEGDVVHILPLKKHKISSSEPLTILSYSTPNPNDYVIIDDQ
ncbi:MAG: sugar phosphate nucleotidyltransferase [Nitrososphaeria archaeon]|jgi:NDP-sugar pyrophosphorylase family protein